MLCPACDSKNIGKIGVNQYYCWDCFVEFNDRNEMFLVDEDATLISSNEPVYTS